MCHKKKLRPGRKIGNKNAQVSLEIALSLICILLLLLGTLKVCLWVNQRFVLRQRDFETTRTNLGSVPSESGYPKLNIFQN